MHALIFVVELVVVVGAVLFLVIREARWWEWMRCRKILLEAGDNASGPLTVEECLKAHDVIRGR